MTLAFDIRQALLGTPFIYRLFQRVVGSKRSGSPCVTELLALRPGDRVLDIGCGTADIVQYLPAGVDYHGFDVSADYIAAARARFGSRGSFSVQAVPMDLKRLPWHQFDVVIALGVLHHLTDDEASALFAVAHTALKPGGRVFSIDGAYVPNQSAIARFLLKLDRGQHVRSPEQYIAIAQRSFPTARARVFRNFLRIPYTHCVVEAVRGQP